MLGSHVTEADPKGDRTDRGVSTRRVKVWLLLQHKGIEEESIESLVEEDMSNMLALFRDFSDGSHGHAGQFTITQLSPLRIRVESVISFIHALCAG